MTYKLLENETFPQLETRIAKFWESNNIFQRSVDETKGGEFVFYDGPPFANGLPHYGHLLTSFIKDIYARYQTMQGLKTERRFGWDCHGLPAEMEVEKQIGIQGRVDITKYGIGKFNDECEKSVMKYSSDWEDYITKAGRWVDFENDYKTMDISYMESVIWAFKNLYDKGLVYEDYRVMPYSWKAETPLSNFETRMDNAYREKTSKAVTVKFELTSGKHAGKKLLVWTTTPWTLPSNLMLAVGKDVDYSVVRHENELIIVASTLVSKNFKDAHIVANIKGEELVGSSYLPLFPYFASHANSFKVLHGDFVTTEDGTGVVHIAPGFGEDDWNLCKKNNKTTTFNLTIMLTRLEINKTPDKENYIFIATHEGGEELVKAFLNEYTNETGLTIKHIEEKEVSVSRVFWFATKKQADLEYEIDLEVIMHGVFNSIKDENGNIIPKQKDLHNIIEISRNRHLTFQDIQKQEEDIF